MTLPPRVLILVLLLLSRLTSPAQSPRAGWVNANKDSTIYVEEIRIFNSSEIGSYYKPSDEESFNFHYYLADSDEPSSLNGAYGLLAEYGATNNSVRARLDQWPAFKRDIESKKKTDEQITKFLNDIRITSLQAIRNYYLLLLEFAKKQKPDIYKSYIENYSLRLAFTTTQREANRLINEYDAVLIELVKVLRVQGREAQVTGNFMWIGSSAAFLKEASYDQPFEKRYHPVSAEFSLTNSILSKSSKKLPFNIIRPADSRFGTDIKKSDLFIAISQLADPDAHEILLRVSNPTEYTRYARDTSFTSLISNFNTVVHESCHMVNSQCDYNCFYSYFISASIQIPVLRTTVFNSRELNKVVPENYKTALFRYSTYVGNEDNNGSKVSGIYGMLDEFAAYYHGDKIDWGMKKNTDKLNKRYPDYDFSKCGSTTDKAYYELTIFMGWYIEFARKNYPDQYRYIVSDKPFKVAYTLLDAHFKKLVEERSGTQPGSPYQELYKETRVVLDILRIPGCTDENYKTYLK